MLNKRSIPTPILATFITLSPNIARAAEDSISSFLPPIWPFIAIMMFIFVFRKQLNCVLPSEPQKKPPPQEEPTSQEEPVSPLNQEQISTEPETPNDATDIDSGVSDTIIDLKDNSQQCQASTAKGTRCKRKTTLEETSVTIDEKNYFLTVCRQHNTSTLKPFKELIM